MSPRHKQSRLAATWEHSREQVTHSGPSLSFPVNPMRVYTVGVG